MSAVYNWLEKFITSTAWEMTRPKPYGAFHLIFVFVGLALCVLFAWRLRNADEKTNRRLLVTIGITLMVSEVYRQLFQCIQVGKGEFQWWAFPFQLCDMPMYLCVIAPLLKKGKVQQGMYNFMVAYNLLGGFMALVEPSGLTHEYITLTFHAFIWHILLVFIGLYLALSNRAGARMKDYWSATATFLVLCCVAFGINVALRDVSNGTTNMFFVGPSDSSLVVFKDISKRFGWYVSTMLYIPSVCLGAFLVFSLWRWYHNKFLAKNEEIPAETEEKTQSAEPSEEHTEALV